MPGLSSHATRRFPSRVRSGRCSTRPCPKSRTRERRGPCSKSPRPMSQTPARRGPHLVRLRSQRTGLGRGLPRRRVPVAPPAPGSRPPVRSGLPLGTTTRKTRTTSCFSTIVFQKRAAHPQPQPLLRHAVDSGPWTKNSLQRPSRHARHLATDSPTSLMAMCAPDRLPPLPTLRYHCAVSAVAIRGGSCSTMRWALTICFSD